MNNPNVVLTTMLLVMPIFLFSQITSTYHQTFPMEKSITSIIVDIDYPFEIKNYLGTTVLVETDIQLKHGSKNLLDYFIQTGRYKVIQKEYPATIKLKMKPLIRKPITTLQGICKEDVLLTLYIPQQYSVSTAGRKAIASR